MDIIRNNDGNLVVPIIPGRHDEDAGIPAEDAPTTRLLHPGEGGYIEALAQWDLQQVGSHAATSTASGRDEAMAVVHAVAEDPEHDVAKAVESLHDAEVERRGTSPCPGRRNPVGQGLRRRSRRRRGRRADRHPHRREDHR